MIYLLFVPFLLMSIFIINRLKNLKKHDNVLYEFCQVRRDIIKILRRNSNTQDDYIYLRNILEPLNTMIHYYNDCKISLFNLDKFIENVRNLKKSSKTVEYITSNTELSEIHQRYGHAIFNAFFTYTPFIRSKAVLGLLIYLLKFIVTLSKILFNLSLLKFNRILAYLYWLLEDSRQYGYKLRPI